MPHWEQEEKRDFGSPCKATNPYKKPTNIKKPQNFTLPENVDSKNDHTKVTIDGILTITDILEKTIPQSTIRFCTKVEGALIAETAENATAKYIQQQQQSSLADEILENITTEVPLDKSYMRQHIDETVRKEVQKQSNRATKNNVPPTNLPHGQTQAQHGPLPLPGIPITTPTPQTHNKQRDSMHPTHRKQLTQQSQHGVQHHQQKTSGVDQIPSDSTPHPRQGTTHQSQHSTNTILHNNATRTQRSNGNHQQTTTTTTTTAKHDEPIRSQTDTHRPQPTPTTTQPKKTTTPRTTAKIQTTKGTITTRTIERQEVTVAVDSTTLQEETTNTLE